LPVLSVLNRYRPDTLFSGQSSCWLACITSLRTHAECSPWYILDGKLDRLVKAFRNITQSYKRRGSHHRYGGKVATADDCIDYIFTDPPFGENLPYAELNFWSRHGTA
jgi:hypothetical protein